MGGQEYWECCSPDLDAAYAAVRSRDNVFCPACQFLHVVCAQKSMSGWGHGDSEGRGRHAFAAQAPNMRLHINNVHVIIR